MFEYVCGIPENPINHKVLNAALKELNLEGFYGTSSLVRRLVDSVQLAVPRYIVVKTTVPIPPERGGEVRQVITIHITEQQALGLASEE